MSENCPGTNERGEPCGLDTGWGVDGESTGPCTYHRDDDDDSPSRGAPKGNNFAVGNDGGAPEGNDNAVGNSGGPGAPEGHFRNLETGARTSAERWMEWLEDHAPERFYQLYKEYVAELLDDGANPAQASRIARLWTRADFNDMELIKNEFETENYYEGEFVGMEFDTDRDSAVIKSEREARLLRREEEQSPYSQSETAADVMVEGGLSIEISDSVVETDDE